jgi:hypothetical protein
MLLLIRPDSWNFPLLVHVGGAMVLVASVIVAVVALLQSWRTVDAAASAALFRFGALTMFFAALPSYFVMRIGAEWILSREHLTNSNASWIGIGFATADGGGVILLITLILLGIALRRARRGAAAGTLGRIGSVLALILVLAYGIAIWAMTSKPS